MLSEQQEIWTTDEQQSYCLVYHWKIVAEQQHTEQQLETTGNWNSRQTTELLVSLSLENGS